jgi:hypothetical protein
VNLSWKLAGVLRGDFEHCILNSYQVERKPVGQLVAQTATKIRKNNFQIPTENRSLLSENTMAGNAYREEIGEKIRLQNLAEFKSPGIQLGLYYQNSPLISYEPNQIFAEIEIAEFQPSSAPGFRLPHVFVDDGKSVFDLLGKNLTVISRKKCELELNVSFVTYVTLSAMMWPFGEWQHLLVRPDLTIAWRGNDPEHIIAAVEKVICKKVI